MAVLSINKCFMVLRFSQGSSQWHENGEIIFIGKWRKKKKKEKEGKRREKEKGRKRKKKKGKEKRREKKKEGKRRKKGKEERREKKKEERERWERCPQKDEPRTHVCRVYFSINQRTTFWYQIFHSHELSSYFILLSLLLLSYFSTSSLQRKKLPLYVCFPSHSIGSHIHQFLRIYQELEEYFHLNVPSTYNHISSFLIIISFSLSFFLFLSSSRFINTTCLTV